MKIVNLTPHEITIFTLEGGLLTRIPPSGTVARVTTTHVEAGYVEVLAPAGDPEDPYRDEIIRIPIYEVRFGDIEGLPEPEPDTVFITSTLVAEAAARKGRTDVLAPDTLRAVRDPEGRIIGVKAFVRPSA